MKALTNIQNSVRKKMLNPWIFRFFALLKVPAGWIAGMKIIELEASHCVTTIPFKFLNKNPFKSTYFAVQSMAAELSTASLVLINLEGISPSVAYIITDVEMNFSKKATGKIWFTCEDGASVQHAVDECLTTNESSSVKLKTIGKMKDGTIVSTFYFTWSMKQRTN